MPWSTDQYFGRKYGRRSYNCARFAADVWRDLTGQDLSKELAGTMAGRGEAKAAVSDMRRFKRLPAPVDPCLVLFQFHRESPHVGVFTRGKVLHITAKGVQFQPVCAVGIGAKRVGYYSC